MSTDQNHAREQAATQYLGIVEMLAALDCDYDRLEELREERADLETDVADSMAEAGDGAAIDALEQWDIENAEELAQLTADAGDCTSQDDASERIQEDPLEVQVRSDWHLPGETDVTPSDFYVLLCTGGPAVRIMGELDEHGQPCRAWLEYQDWGTPWTQYFDADGDTLVRYAQQSYFFGD
jgi:hypothetical protein